MKTKNNQTVLLNYTKNTKKIQTSFAILMRLFCCFNALRFAVFATPFSLKRRARRRIKARQAGGRFMRFFG